MNNNKNIKADKIVPAMNDPFPAEMLTNEIKIGANIPATEETKVFIAIATVNCFSFVRTDNSYGSVALTSTIPTPENMLPKI